MSQRIVVYIMTGGDLPAPTRAPVEAEGLNDVLHSFIHGSDSIAYHFKEEQHRDGITSLTVNLEKDLDEFLPWFASLDSELAWHFGVLHHQPDFPLSLILCRSLQPLHHQVHGWLHGDGVADIPRLLTRGGICLERCLAAQCHLAATLEHNSTAHQVDRETSCLCLPLPAFLNIVCGRPADHAIAPQANPMGLLPAPEGCPDNADASPPPPAQEEPLVSFSDIINTVDSLSCPADPKGFQSTSKFKRFSSRWREGIDFHSRQDEKQK